MTTTPRTTAPWSPAEVAALNEWQACGWVHPFTCGSGKRTDARHTAYALARETDYGQLVATEAGWVCCPGCSYRQNWAHEFMLRGAPPDPRALLLRNGISPV